MNWVIIALISAISFALGDATVVKAGLENGNNSIPLFVSYTALMGIFCLIYMLFYPEILEAVYGYKFQSILTITILFTVAYYFHYLSLNMASNPGYANALVMFHVAILSLISYFYFNKPLNRKTIMGIVLMFIGAYFIVVYS